MILENLKYDVTYIDDKGFTVECLYVHPNRIQNTESGMTFNYNRNRVIKVESLKISKIQF